jgi:hypothetical protein
MSMFLTCDTMSIKKGVVTRAINKQGQEIIYYGIIQ